MREDLIANGRRSSNYRTAVALQGAGSAPLGEDQAAADRGRRCAQTTEKGNSGEGARDERGADRRRHPPGLSRNRGESKRITSRSPMRTEEASASTPESST